MNKLNIVTGLVILIAIGFVLIFLYQIRDLKKETAVLREQVQSKEAIPEQHRQLIPAHPEDFGMVVIPKDSLPQTQGDWDRILSEKVGEIKTEIPPETWQKIKEKIKEDSKKTEDKLKLLDESIKQCKETLRQQPDNTEVREKLERLMMLKSIARELQQ